jgi:hypothetical protein
MSEPLMVCKALAAMIKMNHEPTEEEVSFIAHAAFELSLTAEDNKEVQQVLERGGDYRAFITQVESKPMRSFLFRRIVAATLMDEKIEQHELKIIETTAKVFGYAPEAVKEYMEWMKEGIVWEKRGMELIKKL